MLVFAHRGCHAAAPENSFAAFEAAVRLGIDGIETDVRLSVDGLPVIIHDRVTPARRAVSELTRREIEQDVGHAVPILPEILEAFPAVVWNIEIKTPEAWPAASRVLAQFRGKRRLLVSSFRHEIVLRCADELALDSALLMASRPLDVAAVMGRSAGRMALKAIVWDYNVVDDSVLDEVTQQGWANYVYGAITPAEHAYCARRGVTGLITDYPQIAQAQGA